MRLSQNPEAQTVYVSEIGRKGQRGVEDAVVVVVDVSPVRMLGDGTNNKKVILPRVYYRVESRRSEEPRVVVAMEMGGGGRWMRGMQVKKKSGRGID